jgi:hypothetical protein
VQNRYFYKNWRYFFLRFRSEEVVRSYFVKKSGEETIVSNYSANLQNYAKKLVFLPDNSEDLHVYLPLLMHLAQIEAPESLLFVSPQHHRHLLKALNLQDFTTLYNTAHFVFGDPEFIDLQRSIQAESFELVLFLDKQFPLLKLFLARYSGAPVRLAINCDHAYPFLNISLRQSQNGDSVYANRQLLFKHFNLPSSSILEKAVHYVRGAVREDDSSLPTRHVVLLNMEPDLDGVQWTREQLQSIQKCISNKYRILALFAPGQKDESVTNELHRLQIRIAPIPSSSGALLDMLRQYRAIISRNSDHAHLCINLGHLPTYIASSGNTRFPLPESVKSMTILEDKPVFDPTDFASI